MKRHALSIATIVVALAAALSLMGCAGMNLRGFAEGEVNVQPPRDNFQEPGYYGPGGFDQGYYGPARVLLICQDPRKIFRYDVIKKTSSGDWPIKGPGGNDYFIVNGNEPGFVIYLEQGWTYEVHAYTSNRGGVIDGVRMANWTITPNGPPMKYDGSGNPYHDILVTP